MTAQRHTLLRTGGIVVVLIGMILLQAATAHAQQARTNTPGVMPGTTTDTRQCTHGSPALANFQAKLWLAWTGCDTQHHLNIESSTDGLTWGNKVTLTDTAMDLTGPALVPFNNELYIAWAGTDSPSHMWIGYFDPSAPSPTLHTHTRLADSTNHSPTMAVYSSQLWLAWTGTDAAHRLNFENNWDGINFHNKVTVPDGSSQGPGIAAFNNNLYVGWAGTDANHSENIAYFWPAGDSILGKVTFPDNANGGDVGVAAGNGELWEAALCSLANCNTGLRDSADGVNWGDPVGICEGSDLGCSYYGVKLSAFGSCPTMWEAWEAGSTTSIWVRCSL